MVFHSLHCDILSLAGLLPVWEGKLSFSFWDSKVIAKAVWTCKVCVSSCWVCNWQGVVRHESSLCWSLLHFSKVSFINFHNAQLRSKRFKGSLYSDFRIPSSVAPLLPAFLPFIFQLFWYSQTPSFDFFRQIRLHILFDLQAIWMKVVCFTSVTTHLSFQVLSFFLLEVRWWG